MVRGFGRNFASLVPVPLLFWLSASGQCPGIYVDFARLSELVDS
jgi:hypothetical protein